jgi:hypothetical protein
MPETTVVQDVAQDIGLFLPMFGKILGLFEAMFAHTGSNADAQAQLAAAVAEHETLTAQLSPPADTPSSE